MTNHTDKICAFEGNKWQPKCTHKVSDKARFCCTTHRVYQYLINKEKEEMKDNARKRRIRTIHDYKGFLKFVNDMKITDKNLKRLGYENVFINDINTIIDIMKPSFLHWSIKDSDTMIFSGLLSFKFIWEALRQPRYNYHLSNAWIIPCKAYIKKHHPELCKYIKDFQNE